MTILLLGTLGDEERALWLQHLRAALPKEHISDQAGELDPAEVDIALVANPPPGSLQGWPALRLVQSLWAGVDRLLGDPTLPVGVPLARMVDPAMSRTMAETALWATLAVHRGFFGYQRQQQAGEWRTWPQRRADELQVAVLGLGEMGGTVAQCLAGQGYRVHGWRAGRPGRAAPVAGLSAPPGSPVAGHTGPAALPALLAASDLVINLLPLTPATRGLLDARFFALMKPGAALANFARGAHVVEADLLAALDSGHLAQAVLDVFSTEPLPAGHPFWQHPRVTLLPHVAAQTDPRSAAAVVATNVAALREGRPLAHLVEPGAGY
jgi:glyoxylate/hydroxypyruvate reductase